jgi:hypothetical protein
MPLLGQASGGWTESSSALRLLNVGIRNSIGNLTNDSFTQTNPPTITTAVTISTRVDSTRVGVLSGSVAITRPDAGTNHVGGMTAAALAVLRNDFRYIHNTRAIGCFINSANGNPYENTPGVASGVGPYVSAMGTYGNALYETAHIVANAGGGDPALGAAIVYYDGAELAASLNGYLMPIWNLNTAGNALVNCTVHATSSLLEVAVRGAAGVADAVATGTTTVIGILKMVPDSVQTELVYDQRI